jgi:hypothetical protein
MPAQTWIPTPTISAYLLADGADPSDLIDWLLNQLPEDYTVDLNPMGGLVVTPPEGDPTPGSYIYVGSYVWVDQGKVKTRSQPDFESYYSLQA